MKDLLDMLVKEKRQIKNKELKVENSVLEEMIYRFSKVENYPLNDFSNQIPKKYTALDVQNFSLLIPSLIPNSIINEAHYKISMYLAALINNCKEDGIVIYAPPWKINYFGIWLEKKVIANGDIGDYIGKHMENGIIILNGNAENGVGSMMSGLIIVNGNVKNYPGEYMDGGTVIINGNAENDIGFGLISGEITINGNAGRNIGQSSKGIIRLNGEYKNISQICPGGEIHHKGKLIAKDGKMLI